MVVTWHLIFYYYKMTVSVRGGTGGDSAPPNSTTPVQQGGQSNDSGQQQDNENSVIQNDDSSSLLLPNGEVAFPLTELSKLDEMINRPRWVVPVLPKGELEVLLEASIKLCRAGMSSCICFCPERDKSFMRLGFPLCSLLKTNRSIFM